MSPDEIRSLLLGGEIAPPYVVRTLGGKAYEVTDVTNIWFPTAFPHAVAIAVPRRAIAILRLDSIEGITCEEHEAAASARHEDR